MTPIVWLPLIVPFLAVPAAHRVAAALEPGRAVRLLTATAVGLAACSVAALLLLVVPGASYLPVVAVLGELAKPLTVGPPSVAVAISVAAAGLLAWRGGAAAAAVLRLRADLRRARQVAGGTGAELAVLPDDHPDAYALPGRPGQIVVTTGMLNALDPDEREALFAHERAHLRGRHHLLLAAMELAAVFHPALPALKEPLGYALERAADEAAAQAVGDRGLVGRAIGRAALAASTAPTTSAGRRPRAALAAAAGPVPRRVAALLGSREPGGAPRTPLAGRFVAAALLTCVALSGASAIGAADSLHTSIEIAQGEMPHR
jgi:Zn-dependent protease with chaperone function